MRTNNIRLLHEARPTPGPAEPAVYTVKEVSKLLRISLGMAYAMVRDGTIPARKAGNSWRIPKQAFHRWLEGCLSEGEEVSGGGLHHQDAGRLVPRQLARPRW